MITPATQYSLENARNYFRTHLSAGDYYSQGESIAGEWFGKGAARLGLTGSVGEESFMALCDGINPNSGARLTARLNSVRKDGNDVKANRRIYYDFVVRPPKSVSIAALLYDKQIIGIHENAVKEAMAALEGYAGTRVRRGGEMTDRKTGNFVGAYFMHDTSRELDPLLHTHCVLFNATWDSVENKWKALQNSEMLKAQRYVSNVYDFYLVRGLQGLGYAITRNRKSFEIAGISDKVIEQFSKRRKQILTEAAKLSAEASDNVFKQRDMVAKNSRARKIKEATADALRDQWQAEYKLANEGEAFTQPVRADLTTQVDVAEAIAWAVEYTFERNSVARIDHLVAAALSYKLGALGYSPKEIIEHLKTDDFIVDWDGNRVTSKVALQREFQIVEYAKEGRATCEPLVKQTPSLEGLDEEQKLAAQQILGSEDRVMLFCGRAGTGKSRTLETLVAELKKSGHRIHIATPQGKQAKELKTDAHSVSTISALLLKNDIEKGSVIIIDEAGQVGGKTMESIIRLVRQKNCRLILSGDTRQYGAVEASDILKAIEKHSGLVAATIRKIRRQDPALGKTEKEKARISEYRNAVKAAAEGEAWLSLHRLVKMECVEQIEDRDKKINTVADEFIRAMATTKAIVVSQTRDEVDLINSKVTEKLIEKGIITESKTIPTFLSKDLLDAEKRLPHSYAKDDVLRFHKKYGKNRPGDLVTVVEATAEKLVVKTLEGRVTRVAYSAAPDFEVYERKELCLGVNSHIVIKANIKDNTGTEIKNGEIGIIRRVDENGNIVAQLNDGTDIQLSPEKQFLKSGYAVTSYGAQGTTVNHVILSDSGSRLATSIKQWYVSISRGRISCKIFTGSLEALAKNIGVSGERELALTLKEFAKENTVENLMIKAIDFAKYISNTIKEGLTHGTR